MSELQPLMEWLSAHPWWALAVVFLIAMADALLVIGILVPAIPLLFGIGALAALDALNFWSCVVVATAGAVVGDGVSFLAGRWLGPGVFRSRLAQRYPVAVARSQRFFDDHGKKSILLGRFIGIVRPLIPAVAGAHGMRPWVFLVLDSVAGALWALAYLVPGLVFGASLGLASEVATRLATLFVLLFVLVAVLAWIVNKAVIILQAHAEAWIAAVLDWSHRHRVLGRLGGWLADPDQPETPALAAFAVILFALGGLGLALWWGWYAPTPAPTDMWTYLVAQDLRTPVTTAMALAIATLAEWRVYGPVALAVLVTLLLTRRPRAAAHWLAAVGFGAAFTLGLYFLLDVPDPAHFFRGERLSRLSGSDLVLATVIYGFVPVLLTTKQSAAWRVHYYGVTATLIALVLAAELYLGTVWLSVGLSAVVLGGIWVALLGVGYRRHRPDLIPSRELLPIVAGVLVAAAALQGSLEMRRSEGRATADAQRIAGGKWWNGEHAALPVYRVDSAGREKQPLTVQWAGDLGHIEAVLRDAGWERPPGLDWATSLRWLAISAPLAELPLLPQVHAGQHEALMLRKPAGPDQQWVIRLWPSQVRLDRVPLWIGTLSLQVGHRTLRLVRYPRTDKDFDAPLAALQPPLPGFEVRRAQHRRRDDDGATWSGALWLLRPARAPAAPAPPPGRP